MAEVTTNLSGTTINATATVVVSAPEAVVVAMTTVIATSTGTVPAGARSMSFVNTGNADAIVNGQVLAAGVGLSLPFLGTNISYGGISYDATGTTLRIDYFVC